MAFTRGVGPGTNTGASSTLVLPISGTTAGRMLVIAAAWDDVSFGEQTITTIDVNGQSATPIASTKFTRTTGMGDVSGQLAYLPTLSSGGDKTVIISFSAGGTYSSGSVMEYAGQDPASQPDGTGIATTGVDVQASAPLTTINANALIVAFCCSNYAQPTAGGAYTLWGSFPNIGYYQEVEDKLDAGSAASKTIDFTDPTFGNWVISAAAFKPAAGGGGRAAKNTRGWGLGTELGMGIWMPNEL